MFTPGNVTFLNPDRRRNSYSARPFRKQEGIVENRSTHLPVTFLSKRPRFTRISSGLLALAFATFHAHAAFTPSEDGLYAVFDTSEGEFAAELYFEQAPLTVANFVGLAEGSVLRWDVEEKQPISGPFYDGITFHRVLKSTLIQSGSPNGRGTDGPGYTFPDETSESLTHSAAGTLSMANSGPNTNGSQFFITIIPTPSLDGRFTVFGKIVSGMDVVSDIGEVPLVANDVNGQVDKPESEITINSVEIIRQGLAARQFNPRDHDVPNVFYPTIDLEIGDSKTTATFPRKKYAEYIVRTSSDLTNWEVEETLDPSYDAPSSHQLEITDLLNAEKNAFVDVMEVTSPRSIDASGTEIEMSLDDGEALISLNLSDRSSGTFDFDIYDGTVNFVWWVLPDRDQLFVVYTPNQDSFSLSRVMQFYLTWTSDTGGTVFAYLVNDDSALTGTFTANAPPSRD